MLASIYFFNCVLFARFHFSRSPHSLRDFIDFLKKHRGALTIVHYIFEKNVRTCKKHVKNSVKVCNQLQNCRKSKMQTESVQVPNCLVFPILSTLFLHFLSFPHVTQRYSIEGILFLTNYWIIFELQINVKLDVEGLQIYLLTMEKQQNTNKDLKWTSKGPQMNLYGVPMVNPLYVPT